MRNGQKTWLLKDCGRPGGATALNAESWKLGAGSCYRESDVPNAGPLCVARNSATDAAGAPYLYVPPGTAAVHAAPREPAGEGCQFRNDRPPDLDLGPAGPRTDHPDGPPRGHPDWLRPAVGRPRIGRPPGMRGEPVPPASPGPGARRGLRGSDDVRDDHRHPAGQPRLPRHHVRHHFQAGGNGRTPAGVLRGFSRLGALCRRRGAGA